ncbi:MAG: cyclase [Actinomycetes bacterium]|jgi:hypothetical protein
MGAVLFIRHTVADYDAWRVAYDDAGGLRDKHGCTGEQVLRVPGDPNDVAAIHDFPTVAQAEAFVGDPELKAAMEQGGVTSPPRLEFFDEA